MNYHVLDDGYVCLELGSRAGAITSYWNPLKDDIDAAWLRRELGISIQNDINVGTDAYELGVVAWVTGFSEPGCEFSEVYGSGDKGSAERLAIMR